MTKEALEKEAIKYDAEHLRMGRTRWYHNVTIKEAYLAGAEPREKRIDELEKENTELKDKLKNLSSVAEVRLANWQKYEKENAELKKTVTEKNTLIERLNRRISTQCGSNRVTNEKLKSRLEQVERQKQEITELKEEIADINKNFVLCESNADTYYDLLIKAKNLIRELNEGLDKLYLSGLSDKQIAFIEQLQDKAEQFIEEE